MHPLARVLAMAAAVSSAAAWSNVLDTARFAESPYVTSAEVAQATGMHWAPDGSNRLFVIRKHGVIKIIKNGQLLATPFYTFTPQPYLNSECGLIGIAFDRDFVNNHFLYVFVTISATEQQIIRLTDVNDVGTSPLVVVAGLPTRGQNHDGGGLRIGSDGHLYWAIGDLGSGVGVNADFGSLAAKVGRARIDRATGLGVAANDNPFFDGTGPNNDFVWARGFRNPYTMELEPRSGRLWINTVGTSYEQIFKPIAGSHAGYNAYEANQPSPFLPPVLAYRTNSQDQYPVTSAVRSGGVTTVTTSQPVRVQAGAKIAISGVGDASFNGTFFVSRVTSTTAFTVPQPGLADATGSGGTASTAPIGGCITGGAFYDGTGFAEPYWDNFFFGDLNSGNLMRVTLDGSSEITSVDTWGNGISAVVDMAQGPDGALYYVPHIGGGTATIWRTSYKPTEQGLVISSRNLDIDEASAGFISASLAMAPTADVTVAVDPNGDADLVPAPRSLTFTPGNWNVPQPVRVNAAEDADAADDTARMSFSSAGLTSRQTAVVARDNDGQGMIISRAAVTLAEGSTGSFTVRLEKVPSGTATVTVSRTSGDGDVSVTAGTTLSFDATTYQAPQVVQLSAGQDADNVADLATITLTTGSAPTRTVAVTVVDDEVAAPQFTSQPVTTAVVGAPYGYDVDATGNPAPTFSLPTRPAWMSIDPATGEITGTPPAPAVEPVVVQAANSAGTRTQSFSVTVGGDRPPVAIITRPEANSSVLGDKTEFFGDGQDDVGTVKADFYVDGVLDYTDQSPGGHYHHGGSHFSFNSTRFPDGPHTLRMVVTDTAGQTGSMEIQVNFNNASAPRCGCGVTGGLAGGVLLAVGCALLRRRRRS